MATKKRARNPARNSGRSPSGSPGQSPVESSADVEPLDSNTSNIFDGMAEDSFVALHKYDNESKALVYVGKLFPGEATEEFLQEHYGGGRWRCQEKARDDRGSFTITRTRTILLAGPEKRVQDMPIRTRNAPLTTNGTAPATVATLTAAAASSPREMVDAAMASKVIDILKVSNEVSGGDKADKMMEFMLAQMSNMQNLVLALITKDKGESAADRMIPALMELVMKREKADAPQSVKDMIEGLKSLKDLSDDVNGSNSGTGDPILDSIPRVLGVIEGLSKQPQGAPPVPARRPPGTPTLPNPPVATPPVQEPLWAQLIRQSKGLLLNVAGRGVDPVGAAESMLVMMPEHHVGILKEFLALPEPVTTLYELVPEMRNFPAWTGAFVQHLFDDLMMPDDGDDVTGDVDDSAPPE